MYEDNDSYDDDNLPLLLPKRDALITKSFRPRHTTSIPTGHDSTSSTTTSTTTKNRKNKIKKQPLSVTLKLKLYSYFQFLYTSLTGQCTAGTKINVKLENHSKKVPTSWFSSDQAMMMVSIIYMAVIAVVLLVSSLLSFMWMPEFHSTSLECSHYDSSWEDI
jgi:hypothetical protein